MISECSLEGITGDSQTGDLRSNASRKQFLSLVLWSLCSKPIEEKALFV